MEGADAAIIFGESDIKSPMSLIFNAPMLADGLTDKLSFAEWH
jgi:hypothetical protein